MSQRSLEEFGAYRKAQELFDLVVADMKLVQTATIERLRSQTGPAAPGMIREETTDYGH